MKTRAIAYQFVLSLTWLFCVSGQLASAAVQQGLSIQQIWLEDPGAKVTPVQALQHFVEGRGRAVRSSTFRLGSEETQIWLLLTASNVSSQDVQRVLLTGLPHSRLFKATLIRPGETVSQGRILIDEHRQKPFSERHNSFRLLNSDSFEIKAGSSVKVLVQAVIRGPSYLPLSLISPVDFNELWRDDSVFAAQFFVFEATLGVLFLLFGLAVKHRVAILYALMFFLGLLALADIDGHAFHWLWPNMPGWNSWSPIVVLPLLNALGFVIIHQLLQAIESRRFSWLKPLALGFVAVSLLIPVLLPWFPFSALVQSENLLTILVFILQPIAFTGWLQLGRRNRASWIALLVISLILVAMIVPVFVEVDMPVLVSEHAHHAAYLLVGLMIMTVITVQLMGIRKDQEVAMARELTFAKRDAEMNQALFKAEQKYSQARQLASRHQRQLATASHDLRQPITSLRATIDAIAQDQESGLRRQLQDAFDYLEKLCNHYLNETRPDGVLQKDDNAPRETYPASLILNSVYRMFAEEAVARHIELRLVECKVLLQVPPLALMRIVSNIVANAVKHHPGGTRARVVLGCRRKKHHLNIAICDNGAGMTQDMIAELQQPYRKGSSSEGEGLGLAIVQQLAAENGMAVRIDSKKGKGSCFTIQMPLIAEANFNPQLVTHKIRDKID